MQSDKPGGASVVPSDVLDLSIKMPHEIRIGVA
jgi:hypothetical protein